MKGTKIAVLTLFISVASSSVSVSDQQFFLMHVIQSLAQSQVKHADHLVNLFPADNQRGTEGDTVAADCPDEQAVVLTVLFGCGANLAI